ncbi:hypothetical protein T484DRAFT_1767189 [Baffinella frigidus]|nr:hypothetical protein T484DRAFT_1767189 [Cryptophyta sp. CCMP2293]
MRYVSYNLVNFTPSLGSGRARRVVASDLNELPLANARESLAAIARAGDVHNILPRLELRLGDGLDVLAPGEVDTLTSGFDQFGFDQSDFHQC